MKRRAFISLLGGAAAGWPLAARAQQPERVRRIGVLMNLAAADPESTARVTAFAQGLQELGWTSGRNVQIDTRWAAADADLFRRYAAELEALAPDVILASSSPAMMSLQQLTRTVPIVFVNIVDPVGAGFVESLARPGGNTTGFVLYEYGMSAKWLELLKEIVPPLKLAAVLRDPAIASGAGQYVERRRRNRAGRHRIRALLEWRPDRDGEPPGAGSSRSDHHTCRTAPIACGLPLSLLRDQRRSDLLWA
jgi:putative tryptophan/tyrosine transport system substrate-binding protein